MAHPLTHLTHGISTRRPFHPAKTASVPQKVTLKDARLPRLFLLLALRQLRTWT
jgi:hypothetical protein